MQRLNRRTPLGSSLRTEDWARAPLEIREAAFFSAAVEEERTLHSMKRMIADDLSLNPEVRFNGKSGFVADMRRSLGAAPGDSGKLTDLTSRRRLELIYNMNVEEAYEFGRHKTAQAPALLDAFPARELIRVESREVPRSWRERWTAAGGQLYGGRMIALVNDPVWTNISRFGRPYPPFDFGSGMGMASIERDEAEALGVIAPGELPPAEDPQFNAIRQASVRGLPEDAVNTLKRMFGDQIKVASGMARWDGASLDDLVAEAIDNKEPKGSINFGEATPAAIAMAAQHGVDLTGARLGISASELRHILKTHGPKNLIAPGSGEKRKGQLPIQPHELALLPQVWRAPNQVRLSPKPKGNRPALEFVRKDFGNLWAIVWEQHPDANRWTISTVYKTQAKKRGQTPDTD